MTIPEDSTRQRAGSLLSTEDFALLGALPVADHVSVYASLHERLQDALASIDEV